MLNTLVMKDNEILVVLTFPGPAGLLAAVDKTTITIDKIRHILCIW